MHQPTAEECRLQGMCEEKNKVIKKLENDCLLHQESCDEKHSKIEKLDSKVKQIIKERADIQNQLQAFQGLSDEKSKQLEKVSVEALKEKDIQLQKVTLNLENALKKIDDLQKQLINANNKAGKFKEICKNKEMELLKLKRTTATSHTDCKQTDETLDGIQGHAENLQSNSDEMDSNGDLADKKKMARLESRRVRLLLDENAKQNKIIQEQKKALLEKDEKINTLTRK